MKKIFILLAAASLVFTSCDSLLNLDSKTAITGEYLKTADGIQREATAIYYLDRTAATSYTDGGVYLIDKLDAQTDISVFRGGEHANMFRTQKLTTESVDYKDFWNHYYKIIGKSNEVIAAAEAFGLDKDVNVKNAWAETKFFRGRAYFELIKRFERLYLNTEPTTVDNLDRDYSPAKTEDVFNLIITDLEDAINVLDWNLPQGLLSKEHGRVTKAVACHVRAQVAMWQNDWDTAIEFAEKLFSPECPNHMDVSLDEVFTKSENLTSPEVLWSFQFSKNFGGGGHARNDGSIAGHRISVIAQTQYSKTTGMYSSDQGGYGWGRCYPNMYLLSLYDQEKDTRYSKMYKFKFYYNNPEAENFGQEIVVTSAQYLNAAHPMSMKFFDQWTNQDMPSRSSGFKDLPLYRMGETCLMLAESYLEKGDMANACKYYNMTWQRAGNDPVSTITMEDVIDEYARECAFEGVRWSVLKRRGILTERVHAHYGETLAENPLLNKDYAEARATFEKKHETWPIPAHQIDLMGGEEVFPQHECWK